MSDFIADNTRAAPPPLIIEPSVTAKTAVIWLHGLGADAHDFESIVPLLPTQECATRMIFPNAPSRPVTINGGYVMPAWYDISDTALRNADKAGIAASHATIQQLIDAQIADGIAAERIVVAGFSQGGAMALHSGLRSQQRLAGIMALSCYVLERQQHSAEISEANRQTPIWMAHGLQDAVVPYALGEDSAKFLQQQGHPVTFVSYPMAHEVSMPEITALAKWLREILSSPTSSTAS